MGRWLDETIYTDFVTFDEYLNNYFKELNDESISNNGDFLDDLTIQKLKSKIIDKLIEVNDEMIYLTYREFFNLLCEVYILPNHDDDVIAEIYKIVLNIYIQKTNRNPLFSVNY